MRPIQRRVKRPVCLTAIALILLLGCGRVTGLYDPGGRDFPEVQDRHLTVSGTVAGREVYASGCRILLHSLSFQPDQAGNYRPHILRLNERLHPSDRMLVFLTNGQDIQTDPYYSNSKKTEDQTGIFESLHSGDTVVFRGKCAQPPRASNPGQFDWRSYYHARNIYFTMREVSLVERSRRKMSAAALPDLMRDLLCDLRYRMLSAFANVFGPEDSSCMAAVLLADKSGLSEARKQIFQDGGLAWLLTVSSLHITLAGRSVYRLLRRLRCSFTAASLFAALTVICCLILTGGSISAARACIMFLFWLGAQIMGRTADRLTSLGAAVILILAVHPYALTDSSFQITCACILSMELLPQAVSTCIHAGRQNSVSTGTGQGSVRSAVVNFISIQTGTLPVTLYWFYQVCPYACILHPLLLAAMTLLVGFGLAGTVCGLLLTAPLLPFIRMLVWGMGQLLAGPCHYLITFFMLICRIGQELPYSVVILGRPGIVQVILYYAFLGVFLLVPCRVSRRVWKRYRNPLRCLCILMMVLPAGLLLYREHPEFRYICLDVGQGSCSLIQSGKYVCLFDAGSSSVENVWHYRISSALKYYGIAKVDMVFLSHADLDHINGMEQMLQVYHRNLAGKNASDVTIGKILLPDLPQSDARMQEILDMAGRWKIPTRYVSEGASIHVSGMELRVLGPSAERITGDANQDCIVLYVSFGRIRILMPGDLEKEGEEMFTEHYIRNSTGAGAEKNNGQEEPIRILVAGHHGSQYATSRDMLELVQPDLVLISCGKNNRYGHPAEQMLERLKEYGVTWRRTDLDGAFRIVIP